MTVNVLLVGIYVLAENSKLIETFHQAAFSAHCSGDNKENLSTSVPSKYASGFCHDRKYSFMPLILARPKKFIDNSTKKLNRVKLLSRINNVNPAIRC